MEVVTVEEELNSETGEVAILKDGTWLFSYGLILMCKLSKGLSVIDVNVLSSCLQMMWSIVILLTAALSVGELPSHFLSQQ